MKRIFNLFYNQWVLFSYVNPNSKEEWYPGHVWPARLKYFCFGLKVCWMALRGYRFLGFKNRRDL